MRKIVKTKFGSEVLFANEDFFVGKFLNFTINSSTDEQIAEFPRVFYVDEGVVDFSINGSDYEFGYGKTVLIQKGTKFKISAKGPARVVEIAQTTLPEDFSEGKQFPSKE